MSHPFAVQKAMDALLLPALDALTPPVPVYDMAPAGAAYPFVEFVRKTKVPDNELAAGMSRIQVTLAVWSDYHGQSQVDRILTVIESTLDDANLVLDEGQCVACNLDRSDVVRDQDGMTYTGTIFFTAIVHD